MRSNLFMTLPFLVYMPLVHTRSQILHNLHIYTCQNIDCIPHCQQGIFSLQTHMYQGRQNLATTKNRIIHLRTNAGVAESLFCTRDTCPVCGCSVCTCMHVRMESPLPAQHSPGCVSKIHRTRNGLCKPLQDQIQQKYA